MTRPLAALLYCLALAACVGWIASTAIHTAATLLSRVAP